MNNGYIINKIIKIMGLRQNYKYCDALKIVKQEIKIQYDNNIKGK